MKKVLLFVGLLLIVLVMLSMNVQEGMADSILRADKKTIETIRDDNSDEKTKPVKDVGLTSSERTTINTLITKYKGGGEERELNDTQTFKQMIDNLKYRIDNNNNTD
jgi:hypothetical protein